MEPRALESKRAQPWEIEIAGEVFTDLLDRHMIPTPQGNAIQLHPHSRTGKRRHQKFIVLTSDSRSVYEILNVPVSSRAGCNSLNLW